jgi:hypothetical protein
MSSASVVHTIVPGSVIPLNYFSEKNVQFVQNKIAEVLSKEFFQKIIIDKASIIRTMQFMLSERREPIPKMNQRVIMFICNDYRNHQNEVNRNLNWEDNFTNSQRLIDVPGGNLKFDNRNIKTTDQVKYNGQTKVGGSLRFYFT